jgi:hypothetical protein
MKTQRMKSKMTAMTAGLLALVAVPACAVEDESLVDESDLAGEVASDDAAASQPVLKTVFQSTYLSVQATDPARKLVDAESDLRASSALVGDFNNDGADDLFTVGATSFEVRYGGRGEWVSQGFARTRLPLASLRLGDFNGDGTTDVFHTSHGNWYVSWGGRTAWEPMGGSNAPLEQLAFHDFSKDGKTDILWMTGSEWKLWRHGSQWLTINDSDLTIDQVAFGDFDGDRKTDVFTTANGKWTVFYAGVGGGVVERSSAIKVSQLEFGDFDNDGRDDALLIRPRGAGWEWLQTDVDDGGDESWDNVNDEYPGVSQRIGNFTGAGGDDVLFFKAFED